MVDLQYEIVSRFDYSAVAERLNNILNEIDNLLDKAENGWVEHLNGTVVGYQYPRECCKLRIKYIRDSIKELKEVELTENDKKQGKWLKEEFKVGVDKE